MTDVRESTGTEPFYALIADYLARVPAAAKFAEALGRVDGTRIAPLVPAEPPGDFITAAGWRDLASPVSAGLVDAFVAEAQAMSWWQPYPGNPAAGRGFAERAMTTGRVGPKAPVPAADLACGFFAVGRDVDYADHQHRPEELYLPIAGRAQFWNEADGWQERGADQVMVHPPWQWHAMRTGDRPVLILWMWLGPEGMGQEPVLRLSLGGVPAADASGG